MTRLLQIAAFTLESAMEWVQDLIEDYFRRADGPFADDESAP